HGAAVASHLRLQGVAEVFVWLDGRRNKRTEIGRRLRRYAIDEKLSIGRQTDYESCRCRSAALQAGRVESIRRRARWARSFSGTVRGWRPRGRSGCSARSWRGSSEVRCRTPSGEVAVGTRNIAILEATIRSGGSAIAIISGI